jgi:hypothetical protein
LSVVCGLWQIRRYHGYSIILPDLADEIVFNSFRLITFVMALLMAFRINRTYDRWWVGQEMRPFPWSQPWLQLAPPVTAARVDWPVLLEIAQEQARNSW